MNQSLGLLEVAGLLPAITVADAMAKTANIRIIAVEEAKGNGWMTVKIEGNVDAVKAAIDAGVIIAKNMNVLISKKVIARPDSAVGRMFGSVKDDNNQDQKSEPSFATDDLVQDVEKDDFESVEAVIEVEQNETVVLVPEENVAFAAEPYEEVTDYGVGESVIEEPMDNMEPGVTCNLCMDPNCTRKKGEFKTSCLHYIK